MGMEIERKFLTKADLLPLSGLRGMHLRQCYLGVAAGGLAMRVRMADDRAFLTLKSATKGIARSEYEYEIPTRDAEEMMQRFAVTRQIEKTRYLISAEGNLKWEVDVFSGDNLGLVVAEIELPTESTDFAHPAWLDKEVSHLTRYRNSVLAMRPYSMWSEAEKRGI